MSFWQDMSYMAPVTGGELVIHGTIVKRANKAIYVECTFLCGTEVVAKASATQVLYRNTSAG